MNTKATQLVENGINLLNRYYGNTEWKARIDLDTLDINSGYNCIVGQLFGEYSNGLDQIEAYLNIAARRSMDSEYWPELYGFTTNYPDDIYGDVLTGAWKLALAK